MKAMVFDQYGPPSVLQLRDVPKPEPKPNEVLVKIHATAINDYDWSMVRGKPFLYRIMFGLLRPKNGIPGMELAGTVEAVGEQVQSFKPGDLVYGDTSDHGFGTFAEYICIDEKALFEKPKDMPFTTATTLPHAGLLAWQGLVEMGQIKEGEKILINGAGGGVGTLGLQIAKTYGAEVTGVDTGAKLQMMESLGFDQVIDYKKEDFTRNGQQYDLILDAKTFRSPFAYLRSLRKHGRYITVGGTLGRLFQMLLCKPWLGRGSKKSLQILALKPNKGLEHINQLYLENKLQPIIDGPHPLADTPQLIQHFGEGLHQGKVVIQIVEE